MASSGRSFFLRGGDMRRILALLILFLSVAVVDAVAGPQIWAPVNTCTTVNCGARVMSGTYQNDGLNSNPFIMQVFAYANECLRLDITVQTADLEAVLISPDGRIY